MRSTILCLLFVALLHIVAATPNKYMDKLCGDTIDLEDLDAVRLKLTKRSGYKRMNCDLRIKTHTRSRILFYFKSFSVSCPGDSLRILDGISSSSDPISGLYGDQCGWHISTSVFETSGNNLYLRFNSQSNSWLYSGFDMVLTSFHTGSCESDEFSCDNGRCVSDSLMCNGYNPCGDHSDCIAVLAVGIIVAIVIGCILFVVGIVAVVVIVCRRRRTAYRGRTVGQPVGMVSTTTAVRQPGYGGYDQSYVPQYSVQVPSQYPAQVPPPYSTGTPNQDKQYPQF